MSDTDDGPWQAENTRATWTAGPIIPLASAMTLRDYFAGQALSAFIVAVRGIGPLGDKAMSPEFIAKASYDFADVMLKERDK